MPQRTRQRWQLLLVCAALAGTAGGETYVDTFLAPRMSAAMNTFLSTPAELVDLTLAAYEMGSLSTPDAMREWLYAQVKAGGGEGCDSEVLL